MVVIRTTNNGALSPFGWPNEAIRLLPMSERRDEPECQPTGLRADKRLVFRPLQSGCRELPQLDLAFVWRPLMRQTSTLWLCAASSKC